MNIYFQHYIEKNVRKINKRTFILSKIEVEMLCFKTENVIASIIYGGVSQFLLIDRECPLDGHASLMIDILAVYIFSISTYTMLKKRS